MHDSRAKNRTTLEVCISGNGYSFLSRGDTVENCIFYVDCQIPNWRNVLLDELAEIRRGRNKPIDDEELKAYNLWIRRLDSFVARIHEFSDDCHTWHSVTIGGANVVSFSISPKTEYERFFINGDSKQ